MTEMPIIFEDMFESIFKEYANESWVLRIEDHQILPYIDVHLGTLIDEFFVHPDPELVSPDMLFRAIGMTATVAYARRNGNISNDEVWRQATELCASKQRAYGPNNIALFGTAGVVLRMSDKNERLKNLLQNGGTATADESIDDTFIDLVNYSAIGIATHRGWWTRERCPKLRSS